MRNTRLHHRPTLAQVKPHDGVFGTHTVDLSSQHLELVAKHDDLEVLGVARAHGEAGEGGEERVEDAKHDWPGWPHPAWSAPMRAFPSPTPLRHTRQYSVGSA